MRADIKTPVDLWFQLRDDMLIEGKTPSGARPPSLRDACYAYVISLRNPDNPPDPLTIEAFVNGLELGAIDTIRKLWKEKLN